MKRILFALAITTTLISCGNDDNKKKVEPTSQKKVVNIKTFDNVKVAFAQGEKQSAEGTFVFPTDGEKIRSIKMYIKDICPNKDCDEWDRYANIYAKDKISGQWFEIGRFINPYWVGNEKLQRGYEFDVTDFKNILSGTTELKIFTETWLAKGRKYSVEFDFEYGTPDYKYYNIVPVFQYNAHSQQVPYGRDLTDQEKTKFDLSKNISLPANTELAYFRTIITGWGHTQPNICAEWCEKNHILYIDGAPIYTHYLKGLGCKDNPINNQAPGNWRPDRAGWCPGMVVPVRFNNIDKALFGKNFEFEYKFEPYTATNWGNGSFYAISTFVVVKSNTALDRPTVD